MQKSKTFCALPFQHLCLGPEGTARICCVAHDLVSEHGAPMSLNVHTMDEIWNSAYMRSVRRSMLKGERVSACEVCYESEAKSGQSYRTHTGSQPVEGKSATQAQLVKFGSSTRYRVDERPAFIKLEIGNLCNLKCRMCYGGASSQIERDAVHSRWSGGVEPLHAVWRGSLARVGPEPRIGVRATGVHAHEYSDGAICRWTDGHAVFNIPVQPDTRLENLEISFHPSELRGQHFEVVINGTPVAQGLLVTGSETFRVELGSLLQTIVAQKELILEILSNTSIGTPGGVRRGVPMSSIVLERRIGVSTSTWLRPEILSGSVAVPGPWYMSDDKVFDDVLKSTDKLERLYITGGEPLINDRVSAVLQHLIDTGAAERVHLEISTNCTSANRDDIERLKKFRRTELLLSLDAVGESYNYIRYPARWESIDRNVRRLKLEHQLVCKVPPVVQAYNILGLVDLYRYCDAMNMEVTLNVLHLPDRLAIHHLSPSVRKAAASRLFEYHDTDCLPFSQPQVQALARYLNELSTPINKEITREFMLFTNDLDSTRGQNFRSTHAEFVQLLAQDGFEWTDETRFVKDAPAGRSAKERDYAWL